MRPEPSLGEIALQVEKLSRKPFLNEISFAVHEGELVGIAGLLGSGRTELARALFGADNFDSGSVSVKGIRRNFRSPRDAINCGMGFLPEDRKSQGLIMVLSIKDNISLPSHNSAGTQPGLGSFGGRG